MASATSTVPAFLDAFKAALEARAGLAGVQVSTAPLGADSKPESIQMGDVPGTSPWGAVGAKRRNERYTVACAIWKQESGAGEAKAKAERDRVFAIFAEVEKAVVGNPNLGQVVHQLTFGEWTLEQGVNPQSRWAQLTFEIEVEAILRPTP